MDYSGLQTAILDWSARPDLTVYVPSFIEYSTSMFNNGQGDVAPLRTNDMIAVTDLTPVSGVCALPADYLQYRRVVEKASIRRELGRKATKNAGRRCRAGHVKVFQCSMPETLGPERPEIGTVCYE